MAPARGPQRGPAERGPAEPGAWQEGQGVGHDAGPSLIYLVWAPVSPLACPPSSPLCPVSSEGLDLTGQGSASWGTWNPALPLPSPGYLPEGGTDSWPSQCPDTCGHSASCTRMVSHRGGLPKALPPTWPALAFDPFHRSE